MGVAGPLGSGLAATGGGEGVEGKKDDVGGDGVVGGEVAAPWVVSAPPWHPAREGAGSGAEAVAFAISFATMKAR